MSEAEVFDALRYRIEVDMRGTRWYYNSANQLHRDEGPAVEYADGTKLWYQNGQLQRTDGPAIINRRRDKYWYQYNRLHRIDGPAVELPSGGKEWWINGVILTEAEFNQKVLGE